MTASLRGKWCTNLRIKCLIIGYMHLIACLMDIAFHVAVVGISSRGFQCDPDEDALNIIDTPWLEPFLMVINLGTHGFYPFPLFLKHKFTFGYGAERPAIECYPGMVHVNLLDVIHLIINLIWLKFVKEFVIAVHQKNPEPMRMFFAMSLVKLILQVMYFGSYQPLYRQLDTIETYWFLKLLDTIIAAMCLIVIHQYVKQLRAEKARRDQPPSYIECLINGPNHVVEKKLEIKEAEVPNERSENARNPVERNENAPNPVERV